MDDDQIREFSEKMSERIATLEDRNDKLLETARRTEGEKRYVETELGRLQKEIRRLKQELDRLKSPPLIIGNIRDILADGRVVVKSSTGPDFIVNAADYITKENLVVGARVALNKQTLAVMGVLPPSLDPIVTGAEIIEKPPVTYQDVGGLEGQMRELREAVEDPLLKPDLYRKVGIEPPKGVLLVGPPGTGKTLLAKAVANRTQATFIRIDGTELVPKTIGEALLSPDRFDRIIDIPMPGHEARMTIFKIHTRKMSVTPDVDYGVLAGRCDGTTGADIHAMCTEAGMFAIREDREVVTMADF